MKVLLVLACFVFLGQIVDANVDIHITPFDFIITFAQQAKEGQFPYQVHLQLLNGQVGCGGALIDSTHILTAAHCIRIEGDSGLVIIAESAVVRMGTTQIYSNTNGTQINSKKIFYHEDYEGDANDIAIILLEKPVKFSENIKPVKLRTNPVNPETIALISGWGSMSSLKGPFPNDLMFTEAKIMSTEKCQKIYDDLAKRSRSAGIIIGDKRICTESVGKGGGPCVGDSGGPLAVNGEIIGVIEAVIQTNDVCNKDYPAVYTNVSYYNKWIQKTLKRK